MSDREDELHTLTCPLFYNARTSFNSIFANDQKCRIPLTLDVHNVSDEVVKSYMNPQSNHFLVESEIYQFWIAFANYLNVTKRLRAKFLERCRVVETVLVQLPDDPFAI